MTLIEFVKEKKINFYKVGGLLFSIGIFLLATAPGISVIFLLPALIIGTFNTRENFLKDKWNYPFIITSILMLISCFIHFKQIYYSAVDYKYSLSFIGLTNWIPFFWCFWGFQPYLDSKESRKNCLFLVLSGSIPLIISGILQYFFKWYGPFEFLNGLVVWFQRPIDTDINGLTSIFNNQNYAGSWFSMIFFFAVAFTKSSSKDRNKNIFSLFLSIMIGFCTFLSYSRNAIFSIFIGSIFFLKSRRKIIFLGSLIAAVAFIVFISTYIDIDVFINFFNQIKKPFLKFFPYALINKLNISDNLVLSPRLIIWKDTFRLISEKLFFGWGGGSFPYIFDTVKLSNFNAQHIHNLPLELAFSYGIPSAFIITFTLFYLTFKSFLINFNLNKKCKIIDTENIHDLAWKTSITIFLFSHLFDITYFDARVSILVWTLFSGMRNILREKIN